MTDDSVQRKPGRRTRDEEIAHYLEALGVDQDALEASAKGPQTFAEMLDLAAAHIWSEFKDLKGTAKVQAFNAIRQLAKEDPEGGGEDEQEPTVAEVIQGIPQLSDERRRAILMGALDRLDLERDRIVEVLNA